MYVSLLARHQAARWGGGGGKHTKNAQSFIEFGAGSYIYWFTEGQSNALAVVDLANFNSRKISRAIEALLCDEMCISSLQPGRKKIQ